MWIDVAGKRGLGKALALEKPFRLGASAFIWSGFRSISTSTEIVSLVVMIYGVLSYIFFISFLSMYADTKELY